MEFAKQRYEESVNNLKVRYQETLIKIKQAYSSINETCNNPYEWAVHKKSNPEELVKCTIPFVGKAYFQQSKKLLVYASAENLSYYYNSNEESSLLDNDDSATNRHRLCFEKNKNKFFPNVHLAPMTNGCLATAVYYIATKLVAELPENPSSFYETIAFGNYGKFSIAGLSNKDYAKDKDKLAASHDFIKADLEILKPDYIILPKTIYSTDRDWINANKGCATVIPIYQINARVVNTHIAGKSRKNKQPLPVISELLRDWHSNIREVNTDNYFYVFSYLDKLLEKLL